MKPIARITTIGIVGGGITLGLVMFVVRPNLNDVTAASVELRQNQTKMATLDQQILAFQTARVDIDKATRRSDITSRIVEKENLVIPVTELEAAAVKTGTVEILDIQDPDPKLPKPEVVPGKQGVNEVHYRVTALADYLGVVNFLSYLEHMPHGTEINQINLSAEIKQTDAGKTVRTGKVLGTFDAVFFVNQTSHE